MPSFSLKVGTTPNASLLSTNLAYVSPADFTAEILASAQYVTVKGNVYKVEPHADVAQGVIALNAIQRSSSQVSTGQPITCDSFVADKAYESLSIEVSPVVRGKVPAHGVDGAELEKLILDFYTGHVVRQGQQIVLDYQGCNLLLTVLASSPTAVPFGLLTAKTIISLAKPQDSSLNLFNVKGPQTTNVIFKHNFDFANLGIGGLDAQFAQIFRRAFASRIFPQDLVQRLKINHVKGILLYGPPGTGKTLIARQIGKLLNCKEPKVVNGPEVLSKFVGESEERIRALFADAEGDQKKGNNNNLHLIIFDEIDAITKSRGTVRNGTGVNDSIVNQLLSKMDGVESLNNIIIIGMTNRKDMLDEALLRPGRFEVQVEIGLPDVDGRAAILKIHTRHLSTNKVLAEDVDLNEIAARTKNFSGAELEGLVKSAVSFAFNRQIDPENPAKPVDANSLMVTMQDFNSALNEVKAAYGVNDNELSAFLGSGLIQYGSRYNRIEKTLTSCAKQVEKSENTSLLSVLLYGAPATGKTTVAAAIAKNSNFPFVKIISPESMVGENESVKAYKIAKVFDDAYKTPVSVIILDCIERLVEYVDIGPRFSNVILQTILVLLGKRPPPGRKLLIIGTTSCVDVLRPMEVVGAFNMTLEIPKLVEGEVDAVFQSTVKASLKNSYPSRVGIKKLLLAIEMAKSRAAEQGRAIDEELMRECFEACNCYENKFESRLAVRLPEARETEEEDLQ